MNTRELIIIALGAALLVGAVVLLSVNGPQPKSDQQAEPQSASDTLDRLSQISSLRTFEDEFFKAWIAQSPEWNTQLRLFGSEPDPTGDQLDDISIENQLDGVTFAKDGLSLLRRFDRSDLNNDDALAADILEWYLDDIARGEPFAFHQYFVHQLFSVNNQVFQFMLELPITNALDAQNYVARLNAVDAKFDQLIEVLKYQESQGILAPKFILEQVLGNLGPGGPPDDPTQNTLYASFIEKLDGAGFSEDETQAYLDGAADAILNSVTPAFAKLRAQLEHQVTVATDDAGVWHLPNGNEYYAYQLRHHTGTDLTPEAIHQIGLFEVERVQGEMRELFGELGLTADDPDFGNLRRAYWSQYRSLPEMTYPDTPEGQQQAVDDYTAIIHEVEEQIDDLFDVLPQSPVIVRAMPPERAGSPAHYELPSFDGTRPGAFFANVSPGPYKPGMRTLTFHEAIPGHHFHLALQMESDLPLHQKVLVFTGHVEGWALYAEKLMREHGLYPDVHSRLENLGSELFRAVRLVVDTGLHFKRWTRQQAQDYANDNMGTPLNREIDRYIVWPGQATAYKIGELKILELRQRAMDELGDKFDIKKFHNLVLQHGNMPLNLLEEQMALFIEQ